MARLIDDPGKRKRLRGFLALYALLLAVGSLYPFTGWRPPSAFSADFLLADWPRHVTRTDLATNLLVYLPLGYALALSFAATGRIARGVLLAVGLGFALSLTLECAQSLLPGRIASNLDLLVNVLGALTGALLVLHHRRWLRAGRALRRWRGRWFHAGAPTNVGLALLLLWFLAQFSLRPFPGIDWLALHLQPIDSPPEALARVNLAWFVAMFLEMAALGAFAANLLRPGRYVGGMLLLLGLAFLMKLFAATILLKLKVVGGILSLETLAALLLAFWFLLYPVVSRRRRVVAVLLLLLALTLRLWLADFQLWPAASVLNIVGLAKAIATLWPYLALLTLIMLGGARPPARA